MQALLRITLPLTLLMLSGCAAAPAKRDPRDPWERMNRTTYAFNDRLDRTVAKPVALAYEKVTPGFVRTGVSNFFDNLNYTTTIVNDLLQFQVVPFFADTGRFVMNSTLGIGGLFDPASAAGLEKSPKDFGQTLGKWGIGAGPYLVLPLLGPADVRDTFGRVADEFTTVPYYVLDTWPSIGVATANLVDTRYRLLSTERIMGNTYDKYAFIRNAYLQRRDFLVNGETPSKQQEEDEQKLFEDIDKDSPTPSATPQPQGAAPPPAPAAPAPQPPATPPETTPQPR